MEFPERIYTSEELKLAREMVENGHKHSLKVEGPPGFKEKVDQALELVKVADYYDFLRSYLRSIAEIDGITQLREADAELWVNEYAVRNPVDAAGLFVQKANRMKEYLKEKLDFSGAVESRSTKKRIDFLRKLKETTHKKEVKEECEKLLKEWTKTVFL